MPKETSKNSTNHNACIGITPVSANVPIFFTRIFRFTHVATAISKKQFDLTTKRVMSLRAPVENENADSVMPAWIVGFQARKDASGNFHVNLDSSDPCWNDAIEKGSA
jgi:hypothetical protein